MSTKREEVTKEIEAASVPAVVPKKELVLEGDPEIQMAFAIKAANALMKAVSQKKNPVMIRGEQYIEYSDWQILARFFGATASVAWSKKLMNDKGEFIGYEARSEVLHNGLVISSAEAMCMKSEKNWSARDEFMLRSMAQTRACAKALRNAYGWVAELAGLRSTPAEEMDGVAGYDHGPIKDDAEVVVSGADDLGLEPKIKPPSSIQTPRQRLFNLLKERGVDVSSKKACEEYVADQTQLALTERNYKAILEALQK